MPGRDERKQPDHEFQSLPASEGGRRRRSLGATRATRCFKPCPPVKTGDAPPSCLSRSKLMFQSTPADEGRRCGPGPWPVAIWCVQAPVPWRFAERLKTTGHAPKAISGACMHKMAMLIFGVLRSGRPFDPALAVPKLEIQDGI